MMQQLATTHPEPSFLAHDSKVRPWKAQQTWPEPQEAAGVAPSDVVISVTYISGSEAVESLSFTHSDDDLTWFGIRVKEEKAKVRRFPRVLNAPRWRFRRTLEEEDEI